MIDWLLRKWEAWLTKPEDGPSMDEWVCAPTSIPYEDKVAFINVLASAGGWVSPWHHPRFKEMQDDFQAFAKDLVEATDS